MAEQKESSVLFSLKELMSLEEDRIRQEEADRQRKQDDAEKARLDAERRARDEEETRMRAEDERRRVEEQRTREEQARVEAIRHAEIEKARTETEHQARMAAMKQQQEHDRHIAAIQQDEGKKKLKFILIGVGALLVVAVVGGGLALKSVNDKARAEAARHQQELAQQEARMKELQGQLAQQEESVKSLQAEANNAKTEADRQAALRKLDEARRQASDTSGKIRNLGSGAPQTGPKPPTKPPCTCQAGDPLCSCL